MRVLLDTNVIFSAVLKADSTPMLAYRKAVTPPNQLLVCEQTIEELRRTFNAKFPSRAQHLESFLKNALPHLTVIAIPENPVADETRIRDESDRVILRAAVAAQADILVSGDKDFLESGILHPKILAAAAFVNL
ncbi:MAG: putative toxin-antitoxin system toxin component, PIN family [Coriobacteriales bacterium]|nr:putative toxin-antitoxin system toxin component, PIN family [Coriobacteriales bacterium]